MIGGAPELKWLTRISSFRWLNSVGIMSGSVATWWIYTMFATLIAGLVYLGVVIFNKKRLPYKFIIFYFLHILKIKIKGE